MVEAGDGPEQLRAHIHVTPIKKTTVQIFLLSELMLYPHPTAQGIS